jgi:hypothetical protein
MKMIAMTANKAYFRGNIESLISNTRLIVTENVKGKEGLMNIQRWKFTCTICSSARDTEAEGIQQNR